MSQLPKVIEVAPATPPYTLNVKWADGTKSRIDLTGLVARSKHFRVFLTDRKAFRSVRPTEFGSGIEWANGIDYGADTLKILADEQKPMSGKDLVRFEKSFKLNTEETACLFKVTSRSISNWREAHELPVAISIVIRRFESDPVAFAAHYRPIEVKPRGRPKVAASSK